ncbi:hypothetical protein [Archangium sp.]|jgi:hypothetical protein|uniref:hypothetical protein n=1 Tax=Archangium sp. TaxID=1872627 RepID=UPI002ED84C0C
MRSVLLALLFLLPALASATDVKGTLSVPTVWTRSGSPYVLKGDVTVAWGTRLTIEPGVQVIASTEDALRTGVDPRRVELIVDGTLVVRGTRERPVELTSRGGDDAWYGIRVRGGRGTVIDGAIITQARQGISLGMSAVVRNTSVSATARDCLHVAWGNAALADNQLRGCGTSGSSMARGQVLDSVTRPDASSFRHVALGEAKVRGRAVFAIAPRNTRGGAAVAHAPWRPHRRPASISSSGSVALPPPGNLQLPLVLERHPSAMRPVLPAHPALAAIPLMGLAETPPRPAPTAMASEKPRPANAGNARAMSIDWGPRATGCDWTHGPAPGVPPPDSASTCGAPPRAWPSSRTDASSG